jgi:hypothetical protein
MREAVVLHLAKLRLLAPPLLVGRFIRRRQHSRAHLAGKPRRIDEAVHVGIAGRHPQAIPARHRRDRVFRAATGGRKEKLVVLLGRSEGLRRRHDRQWRPIPASEGSRLRDGHRGHGQKREGCDGDPAEAPIERHGNSKKVGTAGGMVRPGRGSDQLGRSRSSCRVTALITRGLPLPSCFATTSEVRFGRVAAFLYQRHQTLGPRQAVRGGGP